MHHVHIRFFCVHHRALPFGQFNKVLKVVQVFRRSPDESCRLSRTTAKHLYARRVGSMAFDLTFNYKVSFFLVPVLKLKCS